MKRPGGFTILELLISVTIIAGISTLLWETYASTFLLKERLTEVNDVYHTGRVVMERLVRELRLAFYLRTPKPYTYFIGEERGQGSSLAFTAFGNFPQDAGNRKGDQLKTKYWIDRLPQSKLLLLKKAENPVMDGNPDELGTTYTLLDNLQSFKLEYHNGDDWKKEWDSRKDEVRDRLPKAVRLTYELQDSRGRVYPFQTVVVLPLEAMLPGESAPRGLGAVPAASSSATSSGGGSEANPAPPQAGGSGANP